MTNQHPITPPPKLVQEWFLSTKGMPVDQWVTDVATQAARWGADTELEACCEWLINEGHECEHVALREGRRPKPPSLKEQALTELNLTADPEGAELSRTQVELIRRALEQLPDDQG